MHGQLFSLFDVSVPSYFVLLVTGFIVATAVGALWAKRLGHDPDVVVDLGIVMLIAGVAGARIGHVLFDGFFWDYVHLCTDPAQVKWQISQAECLRQVEPDWLGCGREGTLGLWDAAEKLCRPAEADCWAWAGISGGLTYYGGFIGASVVAFYRLRSDRFPFLRAADMAGFVIPLGLAFGRMGCLLAGCCFGLPLDSGWAISFPAYSAAAEKQAQLHLLNSAATASLPVHPTQLYESAAALGLAAFLMVFLHPRKRYDGHVFVVFVAGYATIRFVLEFFRSDDRGGMLGLSTSQLIGLCLIAGAWGLHRRLCQRTSTPVETTSD
jgi:phosphatidylglycerol---prolipoprotein diacylglyceryl transferase